jgi:hypothetical protein
MLRPEAALAMHIKVCIVPNYLTTLSKTIYRRDQTNMNTRYEGEISQFHLVDWRRVILLGG